MRVQWIKIDNCLGFSSIQLPLNYAGVTPISGPNGSGKSNILLALQMALCGKMGCRWPDRPLTEGAQEGTITVRTIECDALMEPEYLDFHLWFEDRGDGSCRHRFDILDSTSEPCPEPRKTMRQLRDTTDLEIQQPFDRHLMSHSKAILLGKESIEPRELRTYICSNASFLDEEGQLELEEWAHNHDLQIVAEIHGKGFSVSSNHIALHEVLV